MRENAYRPPWAGRPDTGLAGGCPAPGPARTIATMRTIDASAAENSGLASPRESASGAAAVQKALAILEIVADREGATARALPVKLR